MRAFHSYFVCGPEPQLFEVLMQAASILSWKKFMGPIDFLGDFESINLLMKYRLYGLYDQVITLEPNSEGILTSTFWAYGKFEAMRKFASLYPRIPILSIDTDLVLKRPISIPRSDIIGLHYDNPNFYPHLPLMQAF
jgi:hypothetical protein